MSEYTFDQDQTNRLAQQKRITSCLQNVGSLITQDGGKCDLRLCSKINNQMCISGDAVPGALGIVDDTPKTMDLIFVGTKANSSILVLADFKFRQKTIDKHLADGLLKKENRTMGIFLGFAHVSYVVLLNDVNYKRRKNALSKLLQPLKTKMKVLNLLELQDFHF